MYSTYLHILYFILKQSSPLSTGARVAEPSPPGPPTQKRVKCTTYLTLEVVGGQVGNVHRPRPVAPLSVVTSSTVPGADAVHDDNWLPSLRRRSYLRPAGALRTIDVAFSDS